MKPEGPTTAILACMDARLDAAGFLDSWPDVVHVVRNAGGRVTADALRSLAASCAMAGTERIIVLHHTDCAMAMHSEEQIRTLLPPGTAEGIEFLTIAEPIQALQEDVAAVRGAPFLPPGVEVVGMVYDLGERTVREVTVGS